jgi:saccharopine dehydrogenase-like NADP-dependent oxidoreductase
MMKVLIIGGGGKIGRAVAWDLARRRDVKTVGIADIQENRLEEAKDWINSTKILPHLLNTTDQKATRSLMQGYDVAVLTLPDRRSSYKAIEAAIETWLIFWKSITEGPIRRKQKGWNYPPE